MDKDTIWNSKFKIKNSKLRWVNPRFLLAARFKISIA